MINLSSLALLKGKKALGTGIANDQSIAWGCAKAFHAFGADVAVTNLNDKTRKHVEPLAKEIELPIFMPLDLQHEGQLEAVFAAIEKKWGTLDLCLYSIAFAPKADLQGRVVDCSKDGFLLAMELSCWSFIRMAKLAEPLMKNARAERLGIVNHTVPAEELESFTYSLASEIAENAPLSVSVMKEQLRMLAGAHPMSPRRFERVQGLRGIVYDSDDYAEGIRAFREKRKQKFSGQ